jgi:hypothetical protein
MGPLLIVRAISRFWCQEAQLMPEATSNVEFAHKVHEHGHRQPPSIGRRAQLIEIVEAVVLAIVAVATAWSG